MFERVLLGDNEVAFEVFPQNPASLPDSEIPNSLGVEERAKVARDHQDFALNFRPIIVKPQVKSLGEQGSSLLLIPDGVSKGRPGEPSYLVIGIDAEHSLITQRHIDHLPTSRRRENRKTDPKPKDRLRYLASTFTSNRLGEFLDQQHYDRSNDPDISKLFDEQQIKKLASTAFQAGYVKPLVSSRPAFNQSASNARALHMGLSPAQERYQQTVLEAVEAWRGASMSPEIEETLSALKGRQNTTTFSFLAVRMSRSKKKKIQRQDISRESISANRNAALRKYPLLASDLGRFEQHTVAEGVDKGTVSEQDIARKYWKADGQTLNDEALDFLEGLSEADLPQEVAGDFYRLAPYLSYLDTVEKFPKTPPEWMAFKQIVRVDERFSSSFFRTKGQTLSEVSDMIDMSSATPWQEMNKILNFEYGDTKLTAAETILNMAGRIGLSRLAPVMLNMREQEELAPNIKDSIEIIAYCDVATPERQKDLNSKARSANEEAGLSLIGVFYQDVSLEELIRQQRAFASGTQRNWDRDIRRLAVSSRFSQAAGNQRIEPLPSLPDELQRDQSRYEIVPVSSAGQAVQMLRDMKSRQAWDILEDMVYQPVHFVFCVKSFNGDTEALCILGEESTQDGKLRVNLRNTAIGRDDERVDMSNELLDKIHTYIDYINGLELPVHPYRASRERLRLNAEKLVGERGSIGHDRHVTKENVQAANRFDDSCPRQLKVDKLEGGLRYSCPTLGGDEGVYHFLRRHLRQIDPKFKGFEEDHGLKFVQEV